ncbi:hypothetical protein [Kitasatospora aureofaciens]|uniref:hypothetical protein n=1 Tax=Kitasatospora aureofaciens TaxID=1894 RepID=UPI0036F49DDB
MIHAKLTEIRRFITGVVAPHAVLQPKGRWAKPLNTQLNSVESTLDVITDYIDVRPAGAGLEAADPSLRLERRDRAWPGVTAIRQTPSTTSGR